MSNASEYAIIISFVNYKQLQQCQGCSLSTFSCMSVSMSCIWHMLQCVLLMLAVVVDFFQICLHMFRIWSNRLWQNPFHNRSSTEGMQGMCYQLLASYYQLLLVSTVSGHSMSTLVGPLLQALEKFLLFVYKEHWPDQLMKSEVRNSKKLKSVYKLGGKRRPSPSCLK